MVQLSVKQKCIFLFKKYQKIKFVLKLYAPSLFPLGGHPQHFDWFEQSHKEPLAVAAAATTSDIL